MFFFLATLWDDWVRNQVVQLISFYRLPFKPRALNYSDVRLITSSFTIHVDETSRKTLDLCHGEICGIRTHDLEFPIE